MSSAATMPELKSPAMLPPHVVVIENDDLHSFQYVTEVLVKVFKYSVPEAQKITMEIHKKGEAVVWTGSKEVAELKAEQVYNFGIDTYAKTPVTFPLGVRVEPT